MDDRPEPLRERNGSTRLNTQDQIRKHVEGLYSDDFAMRAESITELEKFGEPAAEVIVESLLKKSPQLSSLVSFTEALAEIGKPSVNVLIHALSHIQEVRTPKDVYLVESFVETLGRLGDRRAAEALAQQLEKLDRAVRRNGNKPLVDACTAAKLRVHSILSEMGSKAGLEELLGLLGDGRQRVRDGVVESLHHIGDRRALVPLLRLYTVEDDVSLANAEDIRDAFREIVKREQVVLEHDVFRELTPDERSTLTKFLPKPRK